MSSESSSLSSSSKTLCKTAAKGSRILLREKILQKSFFGVGPCERSAQSASQYFSNTPTAYLQLKDVPDAVDPNQHKTL